MLVHEDPVAISDEASFVIPFRQRLFFMPFSLLQYADRAFVNVLLKLAFDYGVAMDVHRHSDDLAVLPACRQKRPSRQGRQQ